MKLGDVVLIEWDDHHSKTTGWVDANKATGLADSVYTCKSVGLVVSINKNQVAIAQQWNIPKDPQFAVSVADFMVIMRNSIRKIKFIKRKELSYKRIK